MATMFRSLTSNLGQKITAVLIALVLWLYVYTLQGPEITNTFTAKISIRNMPENTKVTSTLGYAKIVLRGSKKFMDEITPESIKAYVDLLGKAPGQFQEPVMVDFPQSVVKSSVTPETITLTLQQIGTKDLPIEWKFTNQSSVSMVVKSPVFNPQRLKITGPESELSKFTKALVTIDMRLIKEGGTRLKLPYDLIDNTDKSHTVDEAEMLGVSSSFSTIDVELQVDRPVRSRMIGVQAKTSGNLPSDIALVSLDVQPKSVNLQGDFETLNNIGKFINTLPINLNGLVVDTEMDIGLSLPKGVTSDTKTVHVSIKIERMQRTKVKVSIDSIENPDGLEYTLATTTFEVLVEGPETAIKDAFLGTGKISLKGLSKGSHVVTVEITGLPADVVVISNATVEVEIQ